VPVKVAPRVRRALPALFVALLLLAEVFAGAALRQVVEQSCELFSNGPPLNP
jgi:hypothetical protein